MKIILNILGKITQNDILVKFPNATQTENDIIIVNKNISEFSSNSTFSSEVMFED